MTTKTRRVVFWVALGLIVLLAAAGIAVATATTKPGRLPPLHPDSYGYDGARAVAEVLRGQGVEITVVDSHEKAEDAAGADSTLLLMNPAALSDEAVGRVASGYRDVVLVQPVSRTLALLFPGALPGRSAGNAPLSPDCSFAPARDAGPVEIGRTFRGTASYACYPSQGGFGLLVSDSGDTRRAVVDGSSLLTNEAIAHEGNAALALQLLGRNRHLVWYLPGAGDSDIALAGKKTLADLTPAWVTPSLVLLGVTVLVAGVWRGRRFGPLVAERLPVTVRASETMEGRARLYANSRDAVHTARILRRGTLRRLAPLLGLSTNAAPALVADAAAGLIAAPRETVYSVLLGAEPGNSAELIDLSDRLSDLEAAIRAAVRPERNMT